MTGNDTMATEKTKQQSAQRVSMRIKDLHKAEYNPRKISKKELEKLKESIKTYGLVQPIVVNVRNKHIVSGHQRIEACRQLGMTEVGIYPVDLSDDEEKTLNIAMNRIGGDWDDTALYGLLSELAEKNRLALTGFDAKELDKLRWQQGNTINRKLIEDYIIPPFSVFDTKQGYWQQRKKEWHTQLGETLTGRDDAAETGSVANVGGMEKAISQYDPVLLEVLYTWYATAGDTIIDPFAGSPIAGLIASRLGYNFVGTDTWKKQVDTNKAKAKEMGEKRCVWHNDTGANIGEYVKGAKPKLMVTDPPYFNLEVYDEGNGKDISNAKDYKAFLGMLAGVLKPTYKVLADGGWAIIKIGNVRDGDGNYYNLVGDTVSIMQEAGYKFYNEIILATAIATAAMRARQTFGTNKKVVKTHQNILFFAKGKEVAINSALRELLLSGLTATAHHDVLIFKK